jgi:pentatricopeptide repeat protein
MDEMRAYNIEPDVHTFLLLFRACAEAPHWVDGYHEIIFDAMSAMEGAELMPTTAIYNTIIYAFARAGDPVAAEYYFWEMKNKGLKQDLVTYNNLIYAFAQSQSVGLRHYGTRGRFVKAKERDPTPDERDYMDAGALKVNELSKLRILHQSLLVKNSATYTV